MVDREGGDARVSVVGREAELLRLGRFLDDAQSGNSIVLVGDPGIGKTTLWEAAVQSASDRGVRVLAARPSGSAAERQFGGLIDLCDGLGGEELATLPSPQRRALEEALLRAEPASEPAPTSAVAVGLRAVVRGLAAQGRRA